MKRSIVWLCTALICCAFAAFALPAGGVMAIDILTDNSTMPNLSEGEGTLNELSPQEDCVLLGPSSQSETLPPDVMLRFIGPSEENNLDVTANETWYLQIDINAP
jgi:hypothetical protein